jgi:hypothetical protein
MKINGFFLFFGTPSYFTERKRSAPMFYSQNALLGLVLGKEYGTMKRV